MSHEEDLWARLSQAGDGGAFAALLDRCGARVQRRLEGLTEGPQAAEDLCQEVFLKARSGLGSFTAGTNFRAWLFCIARRCPIDRCRVAAGAILVRAETADDEEAARMGESLGAVYEGVIGNLDRVDPARADERRRREADTVRREARAAVDSVARQLERFPESVRRGLRRGLDTRPRDKEWHRRWKGPSPPGHGSWRGKPFGRPSAPTRGFPRPGFGPPRKTLFPPRPVR